MHPDTEQVLAELRKIPAFRGQEIAASAKGVDVSFTISQQLDGVEEILQSVGLAWFQKNPGMDTVPYAVFLLYNPHSRMHDVSVQVGNAAIVAMRPRAVAQLITGELKRAED